MLPLPTRRRLLMVLVLAVLALAGSVAAGRMTRAQVAGPAPSEEPKMPRQREVDDAEVERLFREYQRLTRVLEARQAQRAPATPRTEWSKRPRGDFWRPGEIERLFGR